ncbi:MAG: hypothetical protein ACYS0D_01770 [Planctomycetota bacterium]
MPTARRVLVCLALGALTTIAVAWALAVLVVVNVLGGPWVARQGLLVPALEDRALWCKVLERPGLTVVAWEAGQVLSVDATVSPFRRLGQMDRNVWIFRPQQRPVRAVRTVDSHIDEGALPWWARQVTVASADESAPARLQACSARGWPLRALWYHARIGQKARVNSGGLDMPPELASLGPGPVLPYRPIVLGLVGNTLFYGVIWLGILATPGLIRRVRRSRDGCCRACGYDLRGTAHGRCPECGHLGRMAHGRST